MDSRLVELKQLCVVGVVAMAVLGGCSGCGKKSDKSEGASSGGPVASATSSVTVGQPGLPDVCKMFTNEEMAALIGGKITSSRAGEKSTALQPECDWLGANEGISVSISLTPALNTSTLEGYEPVAGIGEAATENHGILTVLYRGTEITVIHGGTGQVETQKKIAAKVIEAIDKKRQAH
ncbi:DUF3558 domain-containing protein [Pendulispora rubella]|uniref:DUF3558 domain-containing protein n=1 Tax=Pendulispora rubella TaxID=2741070 RepID=A0ABZ2KWE4_9BACT